MLLCLVCLLFISSSSSFSFLASSEALVSRCAQRHLAKYVEMAAEDAVRIVRSDAPERVKPLNGNGHMLIQLGRGDDNFRLIEQQVDVSLDLAIRVPAADNLDEVVDYEKGTLIRSVCVAIDDGCVHLSQRIFVHRARRRLILQTIKPSNFSPMGHSGTTIELSQGSKLRENFKLSHSTSDYAVYVRSVRNRQRRTLYLAIGVESVEMRVTVKPSENKPTGQRIVVTTAESSEEAIKEARAEMEAALEISVGALVEEHQNAWKDLAHTGIHLDPTDPDPHHIMPTSYYVNSTLYTLLSTSVSINSERSLVAESERPKSPLLAPEYCYNASPTLHSTSLWKCPASLDEAVGLRDAWKLTLQKHGCSALVNEGAEGLLQAVVLSFAGLQFTSEHMALGTDAEVLHNEIGLSNIRYRNNTVDIYLRKEGAEQLPEMFVRRQALKKYAEPLFACEAGCIQRLDQLSIDEIRFPIFLTNPPTPILYISHLKEHLKLLQHTLHVRESLSHQEHYELHYSSSMATFCVEGFN